MLVLYIGSIYSGHHSILIAPAEVELNPALWLSIVSQQKGTCFSILPLHVILYISINRLIVLL